METKESKQTFRRVKVGDPIVIDGIRIEVLSTDGKTVRIKVEGASGKVLDKSEN